MNNSQDKSFEKKLQSLSAGFELAPAAGSWNKIEVQLSVKEKRRFIFFLIPVGIVILATGVFIFSNDYKISEIESSGSSSNASKGHPERSRRSAEGSGILQSNTNGLKTNAKTNNADVSNHSNENRNLSAIASIDNSFSSSGISLKNNQNKKLKSRPYNNASNNLTGAKNSELSIVESSILTNENEIANEELIRMTLLNPAPISNNNKSPVGINFQQTQQAKKSSRWSVGFTYLPMFTNRKVSYDLQNSNHAFIDDTSYKRKDEYLFSHNVGVDVYFSITSKLYLHSGLYSITYGEKSFYDNKVYQNIIASPFTVLDYANYIAPGSEQQHTNKYSFIHLPFNVGMKIRTGTKTSLNIETGLVYGYLIKANGLEYMNVNDSLPLYALDDAQLIKMNRNQFFANTSFSFDWFVLKNISWRNGIMAQYQLTDLYRKDEIQSQHNYGFGLNTSLIFHFK